MIGDLKYFFTFLVDILFLYFFFFTNGRQKLASGTKTSFERRGEKGNSDS